MDNRRGRKGRNSTRNVRVDESVSIAIKLQLDKFMEDENETELQFPSCLSAQERAFIHLMVPKLGLKSKSRGKGNGRFITAYKRTKSSIIQSDAKLILDSAMRCAIADLLNAYPITVKEKDELMSCGERERGPQIAHKTMGQLSNGIPHLAQTSYNPELQGFRSNLPVYRQREELIEAVVNNQVVVIAGETGCGKTTQLPQLVIEAWQREGRPCRVVCTQPRRISAVTVAERVAFEQNTKIGQSVGYQIRLESRVSPRTVLTYCTNGVLLRTLMSGDAALASFTHIFVDEVHERDKFSDFLMITLRDCLVRHKDLRLILMSATMDTGIFSRYFNNCPIVTIPGRLYDVQRYYLEDILSLINYKSNKMKEIEKDIKTNGPKTSEASLWANMEALSTQAKPSLRVGNTTADESIDPQLQSDMDEFLDECFNEGNVDSFCQMLYMYMSEGVRVDWPHSVSGATGLMAAAHHGLTDTAEQIIKLGADPLITDKSGKTAYQYALEGQHEECLQYLASLTDTVPVQEIGNQKDGPVDTRLETYQQSVSEDMVDLQLIVALCQHIHSSQSKGSILIFLPGYDDIVTLREMIIACRELSPSTYHLFTLHSNMQTTDQKKVFHPLPGLRKIILSTNIAETSVTIDDVVYVVDSCKVKEKYYESSGGVCTLQRVWISKACAQQRAGRAGRTQPGHCYHLCSKRRFSSLPQNTIPEILRVPLQELCLHSKLLAPGNMPIADFLSRAIEPPSCLAIRNAVSLLKTIGALTPTEDLTEIGQHLLDLTVEPKLGKMLLYACVMKCLDPILTIVCSLAYKEPFQISQNPADRKLGSTSRKDFASNSFSDHMALLRAFQAWQTARASGQDRGFCSRNLICGATMEMIAGFRSQLLAQLRSLSLVKPKGSGDIKDVNLNSEKWHVVKAVLLSGLYPSVARIDRESMSLRTGKEVKVAFHPSSTLNCGGGAAGALRALQDLPSDWIVFEEISRTGRFCFVRCNTLVTPLTVALFGGPLRLPPNALTQRANPPGLDSDSDSEEDNETSSPELSNFTLDEWTVFTADSGDALSIYMLRQKFSALMIRRMSNPTKAMSVTDEQIVSAVVAVLSCEERNVGLHQPAGIGQRPKPLLLDNANTLRGRDFEYDDRSQSYQNNYNNSSYKPNYSQYNRYNSYQNHNQNGYRANNYQREGGSNNSLSPSAGNILLANIERHLDSGDSHYFIVKVDNVHAVELSQTTGVWNFNQQLERKLMNASKDGRRVLLLFCANVLAKFVGSAVFQAELHTTTPGVHRVDWISTQQVTFHATRNIISAHDGRRVSCARDGQSLDARAGRALAALLTQN